MSKLKQQGFMLLEMLLAIGVAAVLYGVGSRYLYDSTEQVKEVAAADYQLKVMDAASRWIKDNFTTVQTTATATTPHKLTIATLVTGGYLPNGFTATNPYVQTACVLTLEPTANKLQTVVVTEGGMSIKPFRVPSIAARMGAAGGYIAAGTPLTAKGSYGGWSLDLTNFLSTNCSGTAAAANKLASTLMFDGNNLMGDHLYRSSVPGHPEANTMTTPLVMSSTQTLGSACATTGAIARDANGAVVSCQAGTWQQQGSSYWKDPAANFASLPACNAASQWQTRVVQTPTTGTGARAYTCNGAGTWQALGVNDSGNLTVAGNANINQLAGNLEITTTATEGSSCATTGRLAKSSTGMLLSCVSGVWHKQNTCQSFVGNLDTLQEDGCWNGAGLGNAPGGSGDWFFVEVMRHYNPGNYYTIQRATGMTGASANKIWQRSQQSGSAGIGWSAWVRPWDIPTLGEAGVRDGVAVTYIGQGVWIEDWNRAAGNWTTVKNACDLGTHWRLPSWYEYEQSYSVIKNPVNVDLYTHSNIDQYYIRGFNLFDGTNVGLYYTASRPFRCVYVE